MTAGRMLASQDYAWRDGAACKDSHPELFFPIGSTGDALEEIAAAKAICRSCPVRRECLAFAVETNQESGVWGGLSEDERRPLRREWVARRRQSLASR
ncbi:MAG TPA: WhiB family transcriptional regulator [Acidimicrobiales bacterium]|nr:WhiB family transcriptional regulator [Acidimicrobiales bacterium]